jgi:hypothetical protein
MMALYSSFQDHLSKVIEAYKGELAASSFSRSRAGRISQWRMECKIQSPK